MAVPARAAESLVESETGISALRILLAVDGTTGSRAAVLRATRIAQEERAQLTIVSFVAPVPWFVVSVRYATPFTPDALRRANERAAERAIDEALTHVPRSVSVTTRILSGKPTAALIQEACTGRHDLVVTAAPPPRRAFRGCPCAAAALARRCPVTLLVVRGA